MTDEMFKKGLELKEEDGTGLTVAVVSSRWNAAIVASLKKACMAVLIDHGVSGIVELEVPGAFELPFACKSLITQKLASGQKIDAVVALGCIIKGETSHFEYICSAVSNHLAAVGLETGIPVIFGVLTVHSEDQAKQRAGLTSSGKGHNHGEDYGFAAIEMSKLKFNTFITHSIQPATNNQAITKIA